MSLYTKRGGLKKLLKDFTKPEIAMVAYLCQNFNQYYIFVSIVNKPISNICLTFNQITFSSNDSYFCFNQINF